jgi:hypothetical protein
MNFFPQLLHIEQLSRTKQLNNQNKVLMYILSKNKDTYFGQKYSFKNIYTYKKFSKLPLTRYEEYEPLVQEILTGESHTIISKDEIIAFLKTSGTTSKVKLIPATHYFIHKNHYYGSRSLMYYLVKSFGFKDYLFSRNLSLSGYHYEYQGKYEIIDISALLIKLLPFYVRPMNFPNKVFSSWESKLEYISQNIDSLSSIRLMLGVPTWILSLLNFLIQITGKSIPELFPNWKVYIHGGVNFNPYKRLFNELTEQEMIFQEVYNATEGFFAFQDSPKEEGMLLLTDAGIFYEFIPFSIYSKLAGQYSQCAYTLNDVVLNQDYLILITTEYGLYRYIMGDIIRFTSLNPFRIKVIGRESEYINAFGEDLTMFHVNDALKRLAKVINFTIRDYIISPKYSSIGVSGCHEWLIEFISLPSDIKLFIEKLDISLQECNTNYKQKRMGNVAMKQLEIRILNTGFFEYFLNRDKIIGGQVKVKKLFNDREIADRIIDLNKKLFH